MNINDSIKEYMKEPKTVEGTVSDVFSNYTEDSQLEGFLDSLDCEVEIQIKDNWGSALCPLCGSDYIIVEGRCTTCLNCGWSKCNL